MFSLGVHKYAFYKTLNIYIYQPVLKDSKKEEGIKKFLFYNTKRRGKRKYDL